MSNPGEVATFLFKYLKLTMLFDLRNEDKYLDIKMFIIVEFIMFKNKHILNVQ